MQTALINISFLNACAKWDDNFHARLECVIWVTFLPRATLSRWLSGHLQTNLTQLNSCFSLGWSYQTAHARWDIRINVFFFKYYHLRDSNCTFIGVLPLTCWMIAISHCRTDNSLFKHSTLITCRGLFSVCTCYVCVFNFFKWKYFRHVTYLAILTKKGEKQ